MHCVEFNFILTRARWMAGEAGADELYKLLDTVEYLPKLIAEPADRTDDYRVALEGIASQHKNCSHVNDGVERVRYMYPQKDSSFPHERSGYFVRQDATGRYLDIDGSVIPDGPERITLRHIFDTSL